MFSSNTSAVSADANFIEDVFSTWLYTGNGSTQTITNGIDLSTKGGLVWLKARNQGTTGYPHTLYDTLRGIDYALFSNRTDAQDYRPGDLTSFNSSGFSLGNGYYSNTNNNIYASWTFREQAKFFDVVTWTGDGNASKTISHSLGSVPGCIITKSSSGVNNWQTYHRSLGNTQAVQLNLTNAASTNTGFWNNTSPTATDFTVGTVENASGETYVAYLFAHDAGGFGLTGTDNVISCGSFTTDGSENATVTLGYEPQWVLMKNISSASNWIMVDNMRGMGVSTTTSDDARFFADLSNAEGSTNVIAPTATGFVRANGGVSQTWVYIAIRRGPMKTPTDATKVFTPTVYTGTNVDNRLVDTTIAPDMVWVRQRNDTVLGGMVVGDRLRLQPYLLTGTTAAEVNDADAFDAQLVSTTEYGAAFSSMTGFWCGNDATAKLNANTTSNNHIAEAFKRAPGFFDVVAYTGTSSGMTISHNLGVTPQIVILKCRDAASSWFFWSNGLTSTNYKMRFTSDEGQSDEGTSWISVSSSSVTLTNGYFTTNNNVMYLFATVAGVSKVGSYTGTGNQTTIDCGFTGGARFVLIKRTDSTGDWYVFDTARGGFGTTSDKYLLLNSTAAEVTGNYLTERSEGFGVHNTSEALSTVNISGASYIFLAIA